mmetsp:Transcript_19540/g.57000  ORF Transcript_19540/g.57000 Transcript_19540/m.57000 type:complete len:248 (-) Transcript_19540:791-1534(-)
MFAIVMATDTSSPGLAACMRRSSSVRSDVKRFCRSWSVCRKTTTSGSWSTLSVDADDDVNIMSDAAIAPMAVVVPCTWPPVPSSAAPLDASIKGSASSVTTTFSRFDMTAVSRARSTTTTLRGGARDGAVSCAIRSTRSRISMVLAVRESGCGTLSMYWSPFTAFCTIACWFVTSCISAARVTCCWMSSIQIALTSSLWAQNRVASPDALTTSKQLIWVSEFSTLLTWQPSKLIHLRNWSRFPRGME